MQIIFTFGQSDSKTGLANGTHAIHALKKYFLHNTHTVKTFPCAKNYF